MCQQILSLLIEIRRIGNILSAQQLKFGSMVDLAEEFLIRVLQTTIVVPNRCLLAIRAALADVTASFSYTGFAF